MCAISASCCRKRRCNATAPKACSRGSPTQRVRTPRGGRRCRRRAPVADRIRCASRASAHPAPEQGTAIPGGDAAADVGARRQASRPCRSRAIRRPVACMLDLEHGDGFDAAVIEVDVGRPGRALPRPLRRAHACAVRLPCACVRAGPEAVATCRARHCEGDVRRACVGACRKAAAWRRVRCARIAWRAGTTGCANA